MRCFLNVDRCDKIIYYMEVFRRYVLVNAAFPSHLPAKPSNYFEQMFKEIQILLPYMKAKLCKLEVIR